ncbi:MAG TPA: septal ring lytic transglycosylase RlpA family protein [Chthoniobacterales bacterium]
MRLIALLLLLGMAVLGLGGCGTPSYRGYKYKPYKVRGVTYYPLAPSEALGYVETGTASHYQVGSYLFPGRTAIGEKMTPSTECAAHKTLPLPCRIRVTNLANGRSLVVRVNDRGPFVGGRMLDVSGKVAKKLDFHRAGLTRVRIEVLSVGDGRHRLR